MISDILKYLSVVILLTAAICFGQESEKGIPLIIAKEKENGVVFEKIFLESGQMKIISDQSVITTILPVSEGVSGSIVKQHDRNGMIQAKNNNDKLDIKFRSADGKEKTYPPCLPFDVLKTFKIRVNIKRGDGYEQAFVIDGYDLIQKDDGPVLDMFGGMIPLDKNDYSITVETKVKITSNAMVGTVPFEIIDSWIVVLGTLPNGKSIKFILDTGASGSVVIKKDALPESTKITELKAVAYTGIDSIEKKGEMQGASGTVADSNFLGSVKISSFEMGDILLKDIKANVLKDFPEFLEKRNIIGIVGIEVLKNAEIMSIGGINSDRGTIKFMNSQNRPARTFNYQFKLNSARNLLFMKGSIQGASIDFLVDIGSRKSLIGKSIIEDNNISYKLINANAGISGIDEKKANAIEVEIPGVKLQDETLDNLSFVLGENLSVTKMIGLQKSGAVLGMTFFRHFKNMEIDFVENILYLGGEKDSESSNK